MKLFQLLAITLLSSASLAQSLVPLSNPGFEDLVLADGSSSPTAPGWGAFGGGTLNPDAAAFPQGAPEGENVAYIDSGEIGQWTGVALVYGEQYQWRVRVGQRADVASGSYSVLLGTATKALAESVGSGPAPGDWQEVVLDYTADDWLVGGTLMVVLSGQGGQICFDDVRLTRSYISNYCTAEVNSTGVGAPISATGFLDVQWGDFDLHATNLPSMQPGLFFYGSQTTDLAFGHGRLCVAGGLTRMDVLQASPSGTVTQALDFQGAHSNIVNGMTLHFQYWYRDPQAGGAAFNLTDALTVTFQEATGF